MWTPIRPQVARPDAAPVTGHLVYGVYVAGAGLLYVGQTGNAKRRLRDLPVGESHPPAPDEGSVISVADKYAKIVLQLPTSLDGGMQESLHRLLEGLTRQPSDPEAPWLQISRIAGNSDGWNVTLTEKVPADCIVLEALESADLRRPGDTVTDQRAGRTAVNIRPIHGW
jgi:hypothetical protein